MQKLVVLLSMSRIKLTLVLVLVTLLVVLATNSVAVIWTVELRKWKNGNLKTEYVSMKLMIELF